MLASLLLLALGPALASAPEADWALCVAAGRGDLDAVGALLVDGADPNAVGSIRLDAPVSPGGFFLRFVASAATGGLLVPFFVAADRPSYGQYNGLSCALAAEVPRRAVVDRLFAAGANPNIPRPGAALSAYLPAHLTDLDAPEWYDHLVGAGTQVAGTDVVAGLLVEDRGPAEPLPSLVLRLLAEGASPVSCAAAIRGDLAVLASSSLPVDQVRCWDGEDPERLLNLAAANGRTATVEWLLEHGADPNLALPAEPTGRSGFFQRTSTTTDTPLADAMRLRRDEAVAALLAHGADPFALDSGGRPTVDQLDWAPQYTATLLEHSSGGEALAWAIARGTGPLELSGVEGVRGSARRWLPEELLPLLDDPARGPVLVGLTPAFWAAAVAEAPMEEVVAELSTEPGARSADLRAENLGCLPKVGERRLDEHRRYPGPVRREGHGTIAYLLGDTPAEGGPNDRPAGLLVWYDGAEIAGYRVMDPSPVRALGCDPAAFRLFELPAWRREWEYGPSGDVAFGLPFNNAWGEATFHAGALSVRLR